MVEKMIAQQNVEVLLAVSQHVELETMIHKVYMDVAKEPSPDTTPWAKIEALVTALKASKTEMQNFKTQME